MAIGGLRRLYRATIPAGLRRALDKAGVGAVRDRLRTHQLSTARATAARAAETGDWRRCAAANARVATLTPDDVERGEARRDASLARRLATAPCPPASVHRDTGASPGPADTAHSGLAGSGTSGASGIVAYTVITGGYDRPQAWAIEDYDLTCRLVTDGTESPLPPMQRHLATLPDLPAHLLSRWAKTHPHVLFPEARVTVYLDGNIMVTGPIGPLIAPVVRGEAAFGCFLHPHRATPEEEAAACAALGKGDGAAMAAQVAAYRAEGHTDLPLIEANVLVLRPVDPAVRTMLELWWREIRDRGSRDQLSLGYAIARSGVAWQPLLPKGQSARTHPSLAYTRHGGPSPLQDLLASRARAERHM